MVTGIMVYTNFAGVYISIYTQTDNFSVYIQGHKGTLEYERWIQTWYTATLIGVNPGGWGVTTLKFWAGVVGEVAGESWTGRYTFLHFIMYRKYVRKWWLFKRNRI